MYLRTLHLQNFRKFSSQQIDFNVTTTLLSGKNGSGKTSVLEAVYLLGSGESFRAGKVDEMIGFNQEISRVQAELVDQDQDEIRVEVLLTRGEVQGKKTAKRLYSVNEVKKRKKDAIGKINAVIFRPEDMRLVEGSPARRRQFLDMALSLMVKGYASSLSTYDQALLKRNRLILQVREGEMPKAVLSFWTAQLIKHGSILQIARQQFLHDFSSVEFPVSFKAQYLESLINQDRMDQYADREIAAGHTLIGPHKDDFIVNFQDPDLQQESFDIAIFGSRGQQRLAVLWLKICELNLLEKTTGQKAILLLDDIFSELDQDGRDQVLSLINGRQTIITTADKKMRLELEDKLHHYQLIEIEV